MDHSRWVPLEAIRSTVGVAIPIGLSMVFGNAAGGSLAGIGALYTGIAATSGIHKGRVRTMITCGLMISGATTLGVLVSAHFVVALIAVILTAFMSALYSCSSRTASNVAAQTTAILCIAIGLHPPVSDALKFGLYVLGGSAIQLILLSLVWPPRRRNHERTALAEVYDSLANFVREIPHHAENTGPLIPPALPFVEARDVLSEAERLDWRDEHDALQGELSRAEALRAALVGFAQAHFAYAETSRATSLRARRILRSLARSFEMHSRHIRAGNVSKDMRLHLPAKVLEGLYSDWLNLLRDLILHDRFRSDAAVHAEPNISSVAVQKSLFSRITRLPDVESVRSIAIQHAVRYAATVEIAFAISHYWNSSHSFWLPITVALVLRQDFGTTFQRGILRIIGTLSALAAADVVLVFFHPSPVIVQVLVVGVTWLAFAGSAASYAIATFAITEFVVFTIYLSGVAVNEITSVRLIASLAGVLLAFGAYYLWPAWHWPQVWETLRSAIEAQREYGRAVLATHAGTADMNALFVARGNARSMRIQAETLILGAQVHPRCRDEVNLLAAQRISQTLEENAAIMLAAEAEWNMGHPETDGRIRATIDDSVRLLNEISAHEMAS